MVDLLKGYTKANSEIWKKQKFLPVSTALKETSKTNKKIAGWGGLNWKQNNNMSPIIANVVNFSLPWFCTDTDGKINDWVIWKGISDDLHLSTRY